MCRKIRQFFARLCATGSTVKPCDYEKAHQAMDADRKLDMNDPAVLAEYERNIARCFEISRLVGEKFDERYKELEKRFAALEEISEELDRIFEEFGRICGALDELGEESKVDEGV